MRAEILIKSIILCGLLTLTGCSFSEVRERPVERRVVDEVVPANPSAPITTCPDGTVVEGVKCFEMPDGSYEGT